MSIFYWGYRATQLTTSISWDSFKLSHTVSLSVLLLTGRINRL